MNYRKWISTTALMYLPRYMTQPHHNRDIYSRIVVRPRSLHSFRLNEDHTMHFYVTGVTNKQRLSFWYDRTYCYLCCVNNGQWRFRTVAKMHYRLADMQTALLHNTTILIIEVSIK